MGDRITFTVSQKIVADGLAVHSTATLRSMCREKGWKGLSCAMAVKEDCIYYLVTGIIPVPEVVPTTTAADIIMAKAPAPKKIVLPEWWQLADDILSSIVSQMKKSGDSLNRMLLYGPPGTGKTYFAWLKMLELMEGDESRVYMDTAQEDKPADSLLGSYIPEKAGQWVFTLGYGPLAFQNGVMIINELDKAGVPYLTECYKIGDDRKIAMIRTPDGKVFKPNERFCFIATMNGKPDDLPEALADRFDVKIFIKSPHPEAIASLSEDLRPVCEKAYSNPDKVDITFREFRSFDRLRKVIGDERAGKGVFGSQWNDIKSTIKLSAVKV